MASKCTLTKFHDGYANLAAAILDSGTKCNDTEFLLSGWADTLREICKLDDMIYGDRSIRVTRGVIDYVGG